MAVEVGAFTSQARQEFMKGMIACEERPMPANFDVFTTTIKSNVRVELATYMSNLPRLREFKGYVPFPRLAVNSYQMEAKEYRVGVEVNKTDLDDDQTGGFLQQINAMPARAQRDVGFAVLAKLAAGTSDLCFDGTAFFADSHTVGSGDNLMTADNSGNDGVTHKIIALIPNNPVIKPVVFQDRESLSSLKTTADTPQADLMKTYQYWVDVRYGLSYGFWHDAIHMTITDTPSLTELQGHIRDIINRFRTFTLPKGADVDSSLYTHEGWLPSASELVLFCNMGLGELLSTIQSEPLIAAGTSGATITNQYKGKFTVYPTSALGA